jgi:hypothetical protein
MKNKLYITTILLCLFTMSLGVKVFSQNNTIHPLHAMQHLNCNNHTLDQNHLHNSNNQQLLNSDHEFTHDIAFVLRGFDGSCEACDTFSYQMHAKKITEYLGHLSFGKIKTYKIFMGGIDDRSPDFMQGIRDIEVLQASLDGWPGARWDWLRNRTDYWKVVPTEYRPIIMNAIEWIRTNKSNFITWGSTTNEGKTHYSIIQSNVQRMGSSAAQDYLKDLRMPEGFERRNFRITLVILNTAGTSRIAGGGAQWTFDLFGMLAPNGVPYSRNNDGIGNAVAYIGVPLNLSIAYTIPIHEAIHAFGMGTHDQDPNFLANNYSVMNSTSISSFNTLPAWNRYFWCKWLSKSTITTNANEIADIKFRPNLEDANLKYILEVVKGDDLGRGGTYKEKYEGKWYTYKVDQLGTLTFLDSLKKTHFKPANYIDAIPELIIEDKKAKFQIFNDGEQTWNYQWFKNGNPIPNSNKDTLIITKVKPSDAGLYSVKISNSHGSITTNPVKVKVLCTSVPPTLLDQQIEFCQNDTVSAINIKIEAGNKLLWYSSDTSTANTSAPVVSTQKPRITQFLVSQTNSAGCESEKSSITVKVKATPSTPTLTLINNTELRSSSKYNLWFRNGTLLPDSLQTIIPSSSGNYTAIAIEDNCQSLPSQPFNFMTTGLDEEFLRDFSINPNPFTDFISLNHSVDGSTVMRIDFISLTGKVLKFQNNVASGSIVNVSDIPSGAYFLRIQLDSQSIPFMIKMVKY